MKRLHVIGWIIATLLIVIGSNLTIFSKNEAIINDLTRQGAPLEALADVWGAASIILAILYVRSRRYTHRLFGLHTHGNLIFLALTIITFIACGEETKWGQEIIPYDTPTWLLPYNAQGQVSLHNLWIFQGRDQNGVEKTGIRKMISFEFGGSVFLLAYGFALPLLSDRYRLVRSWVESLMSGHI